MNLTKTVIVSIKEMSQWFGLSFQNNLEKFYKKNKN